MNKNSARRCGWCVWAQKVQDDDMLCRYKGAVLQTHSCRRYTYDPFKRVPPRPARSAVMKNVRDEDFKL